MPSLTLLLGLPGSGVTKLSKQVVQQRKANFIKGTCKIDGMLNAVEHALAAGNNVVVQALLRSPKMRAPFLKLAKEQLYTDTEILFVNSKPERNLERVQRLYRHFQIPTYAEPVDRIQIWQDVEVIQAAADFFQTNEQRIVEDPVSVMQQLQEDGRLLEWIPEYKGTIGLDQHSPYHTYNVFEHILLAASFVAGSNLKLIWTLLLHDLGKGFPGIKQFLGTFVKPYASFAGKTRIVIENGERIRNGLDSGNFYVVDGQEIPREYVKTDLVGHFYNHENVGAQLALFILPRLGYATEFALEVASLIQFHMTMPRNMDTIEPAVLKRWYARVGPYAPELMMVRMADDRAK